MGSFADAGGAAGGAIGGAIGYFLNGGDRAKEQQYYADATQAYRDLQGHSADATDAASNPQDRAAQLEALSRMRDLYQSQGLDAATKAQLQAAQQSNAQQAQMMNANVQNQMAQRGMANSGASFAAQQANNQAAQNQNGVAGANALALGRQQQMAALSGYMQGAQGLAGQDNALSQFNAANRTHNDQFNAGLAQDHDQFRAAGMAHGYAGQAGNMNDQEQQQTAAAAGIGKGVGTIGGAVADFYTGGMMGK